MSIVANLLMKGYLYQEELTPASAWDTTTSHTFTVPAGKRWINPHGYVKRNANATLLVRIYSTTPTVTHVLASYAASTTGVSFPDPSTAGSSVVGNIVVLEPGETLRFTFGAAQGAGAELNLRVWEIDA